jgi:hypothetical protein
MARNVQATTLCAPCPCERSVCPTLISRARITTCFIRLSPIATQKTGHLVQSVVVAEKEKWLCGIYVPYAKSGPLDFHKLLHPVTVYSHSIEMNHGICRSACSCPMEMHLFQPRNLEVCFAPWGNRIKNPVTLLPPSSLLVEWPDGVVAWCGSGPILPDELQNKIL